MSRSQKRARAQAIRDAEAVLAHPASVRFLCRMLDECGYYGDPFDTANNTTFRNLGMRTTGLRIMQALEAADPDAHLKMLQAAAKQRAMHAHTEKEETDEI